MSVNSRLSRKQNKFEEEKERKQLIIRCNELWKEIAENGYKSIPFPQPVFIGWTRYHAVREDILKSPDGEWATKLLPLLNNEQFSRRKDFKQKSSKKKLIDIDHKLNPIEPKKWKEMNFEEELPPRIKGLFNYGLNKYKRWEYVFTRSWWFESKVRRTYATHYKEFIAGDLESELDKIQRKLRSDHSWTKECGRYERPSDFMLKKFKFTHCDGKHKKIENENF